MAMSKVLGRVTHDQDRPRGPDVQMRVNVPGQWIREGAKVEVELPRNLPCAVCEGGGCDACDRAGAVSLRGRKELPELLEVRLPPHDDDGDLKGFVVRIPDRGGLPDEGADLPRGNLLLAVKPAAEPDASIVRVADDVSELAAEAAGAQLPVIAPLPLRIVTAAIAIGAVVYALWALLDAVGSP